MITSNRKFGVEIEFVAPSTRSLMSIRDRIPVVEDGSLRPLENAGEYVSPILNGTTGQSTVEMACEVLKKYGAKSDHQKTSVHIHLDGRAGGGTVISSKSVFTNNRYQVAISNRLKPHIKSYTILNILRIGHALPYEPNYTVTRMDGVDFLSFSQLTRPPRINYTYYQLDKTDRFLWLRNVFYFYTKFSDAMEYIVSNSRKFGNMYCIPLGDSYEPKEIAAIENMEELKRYWYKGRESHSGHYDDSRYHNVNLHCFWDRHGTVEIRSHGGTTDSNKILLWVRLHQKIVDKLEDSSIESLIEMSSEPESFVKFVEEPILQEYVKRLLGYYSGISV